MCFRYERSIRAMVTACVALIYAGVMGTIWAKSPLTGLLLIVITLPILGAVAVEYIKGESNE